MRRQKGAAGIGEMEGAPRRSRSRSQCITGSRPGRTGKSDCSRASVPRSDGHVPAERPGAEAFENADDSQRPLEERD